jgi:dTDP-4-dehydrorhamnose reductase
MSMGISKLEGEKEMQNIVRKHITLRTRMLYCEYQNNIVRTMLKLAADCDGLNVIVDRIGTPKYIVDYAAAILDIF